MKYYINRKTGRILIDENDYTPYLKMNGYVEISKAEYDAKSAELAEENEDEGEELNGLFR